MKYGGFQTLVCLWKQFKPCSLKRRKHTIIVQKILKHIHYLNFFGYFISIIVVFKLFPSPNSFSRFQFSPKRDIEISLLSF